MLLLAYKQFAGVFGPRQGGGERFLIQIQLDEIVGGTQGERLPNEMKLL